MGTKCVIAQSNEQGEGIAIFVGFGGEPQEIGHILFTDYQNPEKVKELIDGGDARTISPELDDVNRYDDDCIPAPFSMGMTSIDGVMSKEDLGLHYAYLHTPMGWTFRKHDSAWRPLTFNIVDAPM